MTFPTVPSRIVLSAIAASWLGLLIHNVADLGSDVLVGPETLGPRMVYLLLTAGLFTRARRLVRWLLLGWAWLTLIGGLLSVVPLPIWALPARTVRNPLQLPRPLRAAAAAPADCAAPHAGRARNLTRRRVCSLGHDRDRHLQTSRVTNGARFQPGLGTSSPRPRGQAPLGVCPL
jgi:hypothetical protein